MRRRNQEQVLATILASIGLVIAVSSVGSSARAADGADGRALFEKRCGGCHAIDRDKEGPRLKGVYGRTAGSVHSFQYSEALKKSKILWTDDTLNRWLTDTEKLVPDNDMSFQVQSSEEREAIIAYLKMSSGK